MHIMSLVQPFVSTQVVLHNRFYHYHCFNIAITIKVENKLSINDTKQGSKTFPYNFGTLIVHLFGLPGLILLN